MKVDYVNHMGDDLMVVNAARVSFAKESDWERTHYDPVTGKEDVDLRILGDGDTKLIYYLATHNHWTPFSHAVIQLRMKAPIFVRTQCFKHKVGFTENEVSRRYVDEEPEFFYPKAWRGAPTGGAKQGSSDKSIDYMIFNGTVESWGGYTNDFYSNLIEAALATYNSMIIAGVAPEQARMVLPQSMYTEWYWTGSLAAYARFYKQRSDSHAQKEIQDLAAMVGDIVRPLYPVSWAALTG